MIRIDAVDAHAAEVETISMCSLEAGGRSFGIDTRSIREVLGRRSLQMVPLAPAWIGGMVPYRGEVLTVVSLCALLGRASASSESCVLVLDGDNENERFGLMVDDVGGVVTVRADSFATSPSTLDEWSKALFAGAFRMVNGLLVQLDPEKLKPGRITESGLFGRAASVPGQSIRQGEGEAG